MKKSTLANFWANLAQKLKTFQFRWNLMQWNFNITWEPLMLNSWSFPNSLQTTVKPKTLVCTFNILTKQTTKSIVYICIHTLSYYFSWWFIFSKELCENYSRGFNHKNENEFWWINCSKQNHKLTRLGLLSRNQLTSKKSEFIAHIFYFYIFEKGELQSYFKHIGPNRIQTYWA